MTMSLYCDHRVLQFLSKLLYRPCTLCSSCDCHAHRYCTGVVIQTFKILLLSQTCVKVKRFAVCINFLSVCLVWMWICPPCNSSFQLLSRQEAASCWWTHTWSPGSRSLWFSDSTASETEASSSGGYVCGNSLSVQKVKANSLLGYFYFIINFFIQISAEIIFPQSTPQIWSSLDGSHWVTAAMSSQPRHLTFDIPCTL